MSHLKRNANISMQQVSAKQQTLELQPPLFLKRHAADAMEALQQNPRLLKKLISHSETQLIQSKNKEVSISELA